MTTSCCLLFDANKRRSMSGPLIMHFTSTQDTRVARDSHHDMVRTEKLTYLRSTHRDQV